MPSDLKLFSEESSEKNGKVKRTGRDKYSPIVFRFSPERLLDSNKTFAQVTIDSVPNVPMVSTSLPWFQIPDLTIFKTQDSIKQTEREIREEVERGLGSTRGKIIRWDGISQSTIAGKEALRATYLRQEGDYPPAVVELWRVHENNRITMIIFAYREEDSEKWSPIFERIKRSFKLSDTK